MLKTLVTAAFASVSLIAIAVPAQAAGTVCDTDYSVADNADSIIQRLDEKGVAVQSVENWDGCVRAYVTKADGTTGMVIYDPVYLSPVSEGTITL